MHLGWQGVSRTCDRTSIIRENAELNTVTFAMLAENAVPLRERPRQYVGENPGGGLLHVIASGAGRQRREAKLIPQKQPARSADRGQV
jgi:hypothetical protein